MGDLTRIGANIQAIQALSSLNKINVKMAGHQLRLATGKKINSAQDDPAGYQIARSLEARRRGLESALSNVGSARNVLNIAEGGYQTIMGLLQTMKEKATQASDGSLSGSQRSALDNQVSALISEVADIVTETTFNGMSLIDGTYSATGISFHTGAGSGDALEVKLNNADSGALAISAVSLTTAAGASGAIDSIDTAITKLSTAVQKVGEYQTRFAAKEDNLAVAISNTESARSVIEDADFAAEQMEIMKLQILQQTGLASLVQANTNPQVVLSLFG